MLTPGSHTTVKVGSSVPIKGLSHWWILVQRCLNLVHTCRWRLCVSKDTLVRDSRFPLAPQNVADWRQYWMAGHVALMRYQACL